MRKPCYENDRGCPLKKPFSDVHHDYWPSTAYTRPIEKEFRDLDINKRLLCRCLHNAIHREEQPPEKPDLDFMLDAINRYRGKNGT
jgi:hypothetical protein